MLYVIVVQLVMVRGLSLANIAQTSNWVPTWKADCTNHTVLSSTVHNAASCVILLKSCSSCCIAGYDAKRRECHLLAASPKNVLRHAPGSEQYSRGCGAHNFVQLTHTCPLRQPPDNGTIAYVYSRSLPYPQEAVYSCQGCLTMLGPSVSTCGANGWSSPTPTCTDKNIKQIQISTNDTKKAAIIDDWIVIQTRQKLDVDFNQPYQAYVDGFGDINGDYWWGLELIYILTSARTYRLRVEMEAYDTGATFFQEYASFSVRSAYNEYELSVGASFGTAGNGLGGSNGMMFSANNRDRDIAGLHCGKRYGGGWWFRGCFNVTAGASFLNGSPKPCQNAANNKGCIYWSPLMVYSPNGIRKIRMMIK